MAPFKGNLRLDKQIYPHYYFANIGRSWVRVNTLEDDSPKIRGNVLKHAREEKGINAEFLASVICLNKIHIFQIELGDDHYYFYSPKIKVQAAKRIGQYLGLEESTYLY